MVRQTAITLVALLVGVSTVWAGTTRLAVVLGANRGAPNQVVLRHAERDALKFAGVLKELGGVSAENLIVMIGAVDAEQLKSAMSRIELRIAEERKDGREVVLYFYYSGHATRRFIQINGTQFPLKELRRQLQDSKADLRVAILDACYSGQATRSKGGKRKKNAPVDFFAAGQLAAKGYAILTSSAAGEKSQESDELRGSFFTHHLTTAMRGAGDSNQDGAITLSEAYRYAYDRTLQETTRNTPTAQHPNFDMALKGGQDIVLTSLSRALAVLKLSGSESNARWTVFEPATGLVVAELFERPGRQVNVAVPRAALEVFRRREGNVAQGQVDMRARTEVELKSSDLKTVPMAAYLYKGEIGLRVSAMIGMQSFVAESFRSEYIDSLPLFSLGLNYQGLGLAEMGVSLDLSFSHSRQQMLLNTKEFNQTVTLFQGGFSLPYQLDFGSFSIALGPRVAMMYVQRRKEFQGGELSTDTVTMWALGGVGRLGWRLNSAPVSVGIEGRLSYTPAPTKDGLRNELLVEAQMAAGFHF